MTILLLYFLLFFLTPTLLLLLLLFNKSFFLTTYLLLWVLFNSDFFFVQLHKKKLPLPGIEPKLCDITNQLSMDLYLSIDLHNVQKFQPFKSYGGTGCPWDTMYIHNLRGLKTPFPNFTFSISRKVFNKN